MISENKIKHMLGVARRCAELAKESGMDEANQDACFIMGLLHDIGYEKDPTTTHGKTSYDMICHFLEAREISFISEAIKDHGLNTQYLTPFDAILNEADLTVDYCGNKITVEERLKGIKNVHGEGLHYQHAKHMAEALDVYNRRHHKANQSYPVEENLLDGITGVREDRDNW